jgi:hypothetical protein
MHVDLAELIKRGPAGDAVQLRFALACARRVEHLLEHPEVAQQLAVLQSYVDGDCDKAALERAAAIAADLATRHRGSPSIDGTAHAAVSATHCVARALAGRAQEAAGYAAYAMVYSYSCHAVTDPSAYAGEHAWQLETWRELSGTGGQQHFVTAARNTC